MPNQNKTPSPLEDIEPHIMHMWKAHLTDWQIVAELCQLINTKQYGISLTKLIQVHKQLGLLRTHQQAHTAESIWDAMIEFVLTNVAVIPLVTQSDPSSENYSIVNAQTMLCQWHDPKLEGTLQHRWMQTWKNIKPEIMWSQLCWPFTPSFKSVLEHGVHKGWFNIDNTLQLTPQDYGALDLKFMVDRAALKHVRQLYVNSSHPVFDLVPSPLNTHLEACYNDLGCPAVTHHTVWDIYLDLLHAVQDHALSLLHLSTSLSTGADADDSLPLIKGQCNLPFNDMDGSYYYMGGVGGGLSLDNIHVCHLDELDNGEDEPDVVEQGPDVVVTDFSDEDGLANEDDWSQVDGMGWPPSCGGFLGAQSHLNHILPKKYISFKHFSVSNNCTTA
ncbi:hypothetical protein EDC04DRAFT_3024877 [Pisolithus marmoratus]|nr:hypothetical protein EDC04DRAFT_3024877 [Pisolithus marmoratus]